MSAAGNEPELPKEREHTAVLCIQKADEWKQKGDVVWASLSLTQALKLLLGVAVHAEPIAETGVAFLRSHHFDQLFVRANLLNGLLVGALKRDGQPTLGSPNTTAWYVHLGWLAEEWEASSQWLDTCVDPWIRRFYPQTKFWAEYIRALEHLRSVSAYEPRIVPTPGYTRHWVPYLHLISDLTQRRAVNQSRAAIAESVFKRNRDKRLIDYELIDGDGRHPIQWDFREASILKFAAHAGLIPGD
jgi:hypothetical protein